jgi:hypothetical protein
MKAIAIIAALAGALAVAPIAAGTPLPVRFVNDIVYLDAPLVTGGTLTFWTDSGGGGTFVDQRFAGMTGWRTIPPAHAADLPPGTRQLADPLPIRPDALAVPPPAPVLVLPPDPHVAGWDDPSDGLIGQDWWKGHVWTWDYPRGTLAVEDAGWRPVDPAHTIPVGFKGAHGPGPWFPRIVVTIAGEPVPVLLDTGATTFLTPAAQKIVGGPRLRATSMMAATRFDRWHRDHPAWRYIVKGQVGFDADMIEVPDVRIAGFAVGPVWFTRRPDKAFLEFMSSGTDKPVEGAIGGNAFHGLVMTVDYPGGRAAFAQPRPR